MSCHGLVEEVHPMWEKLVALARVVEPDYHISLFRLYLKLPPAMKPLEAIGHERKHNTMSKKYKIASNGYEVRREVAEVASVETHLPELTPNPTYKQLLSKGVSLH